MITNASTLSWVEGDRSKVDAKKTASDSTDRILMDDVNMTRTLAGAMQPEHIKKLSDAEPAHLEFASAFSALSSGNMDQKLRKLEAEGMKYRASQDPSIFEVKSGRFKGMEVPENLRCAIFQSNIAVKAGIIRPNEVTVRASEFGSLIQSKGYKPEKFVPGKSYPDGTYIVGVGGGKDGETNHVGLVLNGQMLHTSKGNINYESITARFRQGSYNRITVYVPPGRQTSI
ncbi:MAG TPA: hypothetical protein EYN91_13925 [Candidatus Melainabacteria bacterium]|jgi:hypothetical protein|nr:hypothetical protein [Candidatus Melainabacteria bacterium]HIN67595.1 hypothetical protein [Candidatus Obscuribacterales bacterium]